MTSGCLTPQVPTSGSSLMLSSNESIPLIDEGTMIDMDAFVAQQREDPFLRGMYTRIYNDESDAGFSTWLDAEYEPKLRKMDTRIHGARPMSTDPTVRYTHILSKSGHPPITIRWWYDYQFGYNFDVIDPESARSVYPSSKFSILCYEKGEWLPLISITGRKGGIDENGPPRWCAEPGAMLRFVLRDNGVVLGEVLVPQAPLQEEHPRYESFRELADAMKYST